jgi:DNA protecting protein DprA
MPAFPVHTLSAPELDPSTRLGHLWQVSQPPRQYFVQGSEDALSLLEELPQRGLAVVGTRQPQSRSLELVAREIAELADSSLIVLSGLARGIDACAHETALRHDLPTIAILGAGLDHDYPRENGRLRSEILDAGGLIVSEFPLGTEPRPHHFLLRNRLIAGWARAVWVVEASCRSGALSTARWAREQDRDCYATPCFPGDLTFEGNERLIDRHHAIPFWRAHSLGQTWLELAARPSGDQATLPLAPEGSPAVLRPAFRGPPAAVPVELLQLVSTATLAQGGIVVQECLEWALAHGWSAGDFFMAVRVAVKAACIQERGGLLTVPDSTAKPLE